MFGESKINIMQHLPEDLLPNTVFVKKGTSWETVRTAVDQKGLSYPLIAKPNVGERGFQVLKVEEEEMLQEYHGRNDMDFLIQEFVDLPVEVSILYHRFPDQQRGAITSICLKKFFAGKRRRQGIHPAPDGKRSTRQPANSSI